MQCVYSYEQIVCAALALYKSNLNDEEILEIINDVSQDLNCQIIKDEIRFTNMIIDYSTSTKTFISGIDLNYIITNDGKTLKDYLIATCGPVLASYVNNKYCNITR